MITRKGKAYEYTLCNGTYVLRAIKREHMWGGRTWHMETIHAPKTIAKTVAKLTHIGPTNTANIG